jgi:hypothetical protein
MAIELSNLTFTDEDDIVPASGVEEIVNTGTANTLGGNDRIFGTGLYEGIGILNDIGVINTGDGDDTLIGVGQGSWGYGIVNLSYSNYSSATINTGAGKDKIAGYYGENGIYNLGAIETGADDDEITAIGKDGGIVNKGIIDTSDGHDIIAGNALADFDTTKFPFIIGGGIFNSSNSIIDTGNDNDTITGTGDISIDNEGSINTGNGEDSIMSKGEFINNASINTGNGEDFISSEEGPFINYGGVFLGEGDDSIISSSPLPYYRTIENFNFIGTGDGNDIITSGGVIYNQGVIETGNGNDSIIVYGSYYDGYGIIHSIDNNGGSINMGDGNDSIITQAGFQSGENSSGSVFLGEGEDYIKGFGSGDFYGGNGNDTLELPPASYTGGNGNDLVEVTSGTYTVGRWGTSVIFTQGDRLMITSEFEKLKAGSTLYDFTSLTAGQIITVA